MKFWDMLFNMGLFLLWFRFWNRPGRTAYFNPFVGVVERAGYSVVGFVRSAFPFLPDLTAALLAFLFLLAFRAVLFLYLVGTYSAEWHLGFGIVGQGLPSVVSRTFGGYFFLSLLSFGVFLFYIGSLSLIYVRPGQGTSMGHPEEALAAYASPLTRLRPEFRPFTLLASGMALTLALVAISPLSFGMFLGGPFVATVKLTVSAMLGWVASLHILLMLVMGLIIGSWVSMFSGSMGLASFCRNWLDMFLGPMRRYPIRIGMLDLSPIVFFLVLQLIAGLLQSVLQGVYDRLP